MVAIGIAIGIVLGGVGVVQAAKQWPKVIDVPTVHVPNNMRIGVSVTGETVLCGDDGFAYALESFGDENRWQGVQRVTQVLQPQSPMRDKDGSEVLMPLVPVACRS